MTATIITPAEYVGSLLQLCMELRGTQKEYTFLDGDRVLLRYQVPLPEIVTGAFDCASVGACGKWRNYGLGGCSVFVQPFVHL